MGRISRVPADDDFFESEEPTIVTHGPPTPPRGLPLPDFEQGYALGYQRGLADAFHGLRLALLRVGVPAEDVEPIVMNVRRWVR